MPRPRSTFPTRVFVIALTIVVALGLLAWFLNRLGTPPGPLPQEVEAPPVQAPGTQAAEAPTTEAETIDAPPAADLEGVETTTITVQLYVIDGSTRLSSRVQRIQAPESLASRAQLALDLLARAGDSPWPAGSMVREVWVSPGGVAYVDLPADFASRLGGGSLAEIHAVYGVVGTLTASFPRIRMVQILVDGRSVETLTGHLDLSRPLTPLRDWLH